MEAAISSNVKKVARFRFKDMIWFVIIALYGANSVAGSLALLCVLPFITYQVFKTRFNKLFFNTFFCLMFFSFLYAFMVYYYHFQSPVEIVKIVYFPICLFVLGNTLVKNDYDYKKTYRYLYLIIGSSAIYGFLSLCKAIVTFGDVSFVTRDRVVVNFWGSNLIAATGINSYISLGLSLLPLLLLSDKAGKNIKLKFFSIIIFAASVITTVQLANRTGLIIVFLSFLSVLFLIKKTVKNTIRIFLLIITFAFCSLLYSLDFLGVKFWWVGTSIYQRFSSTDIGNDPRVEAWKASINGIFDNLIGGRHTVIDVGYAHNFWLDVVNDAGIVPLLLVIFFTFLAIISFVSFLRMKFPIYLKGLIITLFTSFFITFSFEPVLQGLMDYFTFFCFVLGVIQRLIYDYKQSFAIDHNVLPAHLEKRVS